MQALIEARSKLRAETNTSVTIMLVQPPHMPKADLHEKKILLCCWWDSQGKIYFELLPTGTTVTAAMYTAYLQKLAKAIREKRPKRDHVCLLHDNARLHVAKMTRHAISRLESCASYGVVTGPCPSDVHLCQPLKHYLCEKKFDDQSQLEAEKTKFFDLQLPEFWRRGIEQLPDRWGHVIDNHGDYIVN